MELDRGHGAKLMWLLCLNVSYSSGWSSGDAYSAASQLLCPWGIYRDLTQSQHHRHLLELNMCHVQANVDVTSLPKCQIDS